MDIIEEIVSTSLWTGYVKNEKPISILIIAKPENGKTKLVEQFAFCKGVEFLTDATAWGITDSVLPRIKKGENINHIIIPDLLNPLSRQKATVDTFVTFINALVEEGIVNIQTYANRGFSKSGEHIPLQAGVITCITKDEYLKKKKKWESLGFTSRFLPVTYKYSFLTAQNIIQGVYLNLHQEGKKFNFDFPDEKQDVKLDAKLAEKLRPLSLHLGTQLKLEGIRAQRDLQTMAKARALMKDKAKVTNEEINEILKFGNHLNYNFAEI